MYSQDDAMPLENIDREFLTIESAWNLEEEKQPSIFISSSLVVLMTLTMDKSRIGRKLLEQCWNVASDSSTDIDTGGELDFLKYLMRYKSA